MKKLLLLSNGKSPGEDLLAWAEHYIINFLDGINQVVFIPFAAVTASEATYAMQVSSVFAKYGTEISSIHEIENKIATLNQTQCIMIGGGNTFKLLETLQKLNLMSIIVQRVNEGASYIGWSAGSNLTGPTIKTTNDMPIVWPTDLTGLNLVPFQINPHYTEATLPNHGAHTRIDRLNEFLVMNQNCSVVGLPEGMGIKIENNRYYLIGEGVAKIFKFNEPIKECSSGDFIVS